jgi:hypothetical protein
MENLGKAIGALTAAGVRPSPIPREYVTSLAVAVCAQLPTDYTVVLERYGPIEIPFDAELVLYDPARICAYVGSIYNMSGVVPSEWPALPIGRYGNGGDDFGYLRKDSDFGPALVLLNHEGPWVLTNDNWHSPLADSLADLVASVFRS